MILEVLALLAGFGLLAWSSQKFVDGAADLAAILGVSPIVIGIVVMGFGTSAPELLVSSNAAIAGSPGIAIGNALGSNISNIALILGAVAVWVPLPVPRSVSRRDFPVLLVATGICWALLLDLELGRVDGVVLLVMLFVALGLLVKLRAAPESEPALEVIAEAVSGVIEGHDDEDADAPETSEDAEPPVTVSVGRAAFWIVVGLVVLLASSHVLVWGASGIAREFGVSDLVIGLTIVAIGTSLPELAASLVSAGRGQTDFALGNVIGSNLFNTLAVLGLPGLIHPGPVPDDVLSRDMPLLVVLTIGLFAVARMREPPRLTRLEGVGLLLAFVGYQALVFTRG